MMAFAELHGYPEAIDFLDSGKEVVKAEPAALSSLVAACRTSIETAKNQKGLQILPAIAGKDIGEPRSNHRQIDLHPVPGSTSPTSESSDPAGTRSHDGLPRTAGDS